MWKTSDGGIHWRNVSDCCLAVGAIGALAVAPSDPNVVYAGTGEPFPRGNMTTGDGLWKSTDAGKTWTHIGLADTHVIAGIVVILRNADHLYVAALGHVFGPNKERGVYESTDGGASWKKISYVDDHTGGRGSAMSPGNPRVLYAAMWQVERRPWYFGSGGPGSGIYKTTDGGAHWNEFSRNPGHADGHVGKIGLALSAADPKRVRDRGGEDRRRVPFRRRRRYLAGVNRPLRSDAARLVLQPHLRRSRESRSRYTRCRRRSVRIQRRRQNLHATRYAARRQSYAVDRIRTIPTR